MWLSSGCQLSQFSTTAPAPVHSTDECCSVVGLKCAVKMKIPCYHMSDKVLQCSCNIVYLCQSVTQGVKNINVAVECNVQVLAGSKKASIELHISIWDSACTGGFYFLENWIMIDYKVIMGKVYIGKLTQDAQQFDPYTWPRLKECIFPAK